MEKIFKAEGKFTVDEWFDFMISPTKAGGLQLISPGFFFNDMNLVMQSENEEEGFELYHKQRELFLKQDKYKKIDSCICL